MSIYINGQLYVGEGNYPITTTQKQGYMDYNHSGPAIVLTANTWTDLPNDGAGAFTNKANKPDHVTELVNVATGYIHPLELNIGEALLIRNDYTITPSTNNSLLEFQYSLGTGLGSYTLPTIRERLDDGAGKPYRFSLSTDYIYMGDANTRDNPIKCQIRLSTSGSVLNSGIAIQVLPRL